MIILAILKEPISDRPDLMVKIENQISSIHNYYSQSTIFS
jgi:hypothetical protein